MVKITNMTPFANLRFSSLDARGKEFGVFMAKTAMDIPVSGACTYSAEQEPFTLTDSYFGEVNVTPLRYPSDFVPYKPVSDVLLDATAYAPGTVQNGQWTVSLQVADAFGPAVAKSLTITGPRHWQKSDDRRGKWTISKPLNAVFIPLRYDRAFGGSVAVDQDNSGQPLVKAYAMNPVGSGWCPGNLADGAPAPQIEAVEIPVTSPETRYTPQGFGPIPPAWLPRRALGGTYDQDWIDHVWPNWPSDYDFRYHNSAHPDLQAPRHLEGALLIELENLHPERPVWRFSVPDERLVAIAAAHDGSVQVLEMVRDTVFLDIGEAADDDPRLLSVWRTPFDLLTTRGLTLRLIPADRFSAMAAQRLSPADCACDPALLNGEAA